MSIILLRFIVVKIHPKGINNIHTKLEVNPIEDIDFKNQTEINDATKKRVSGLLNFL